jgi:hypothetical protein
LAGLDPFAGDAYSDPFPSEPSAQVGTVVGFVRVKALGLEVPAVARVVSRLVTLDHGLQAFAVVGVAEGFYTYSRVLEGDRFLVWIR